MECVSEFVEEGLDLIECEERGCSVCRFRQVGDDGDDGSVVCAVRCDVLFIV